MSDVGGSAPPPEASAALPAVPELVRELSLELIRAARQLLDVLEAVVDDPALLADVVRAGRGLISAGLPSNSAVSAIRTTGELVSGLVPPEVRRELVAALATILAPPPRPTAPATGAATGSPAAAAGAAVDGAAADHDPSGADG